MVKYLGYFLSKDGDPRDDVELRVDEVLGTFGVKEKFRNVKGVCLVVDR